MSNSSSQLPGRRGWGSRLYRFLLRFLGPPQIGIATGTQEEQQRDADRRRAGPAGPPEGYHYTTYVDASGTMHRSIVRDGDSQGDPEADNDPH
jgi:hypothetical protein